MTISRQRLTLFFLVALLSLTSYTFFHAYSNFNSLLKQNYKIESTIILSSLSIGLANERDLSAAYLSSQGTLYKEELEEQRLHVNRLLKEFYDFFQTHDHMPHLKIIMPPLTKLMETRQQIDTFSINFDAMFFDFYSHIIFYLYKEYETIETPSELTNLVSTLALLYKHTESISQERGFVTKILNQKAPFLASDIAIWMSLFTPTDTFYYISLHHPKVKSSLLTLAKIPDNIKLDEEIIRTKTELLSTHKEVFPIKAAEWFSLLTRKIELLNESSHMVEEILEKEKNTLKTHYVYTLLLSGSTFCLTLLSLILILLIKKSSITLNSEEESLVPESSNTISINKVDEESIHQPFQNISNSKALPKCQTILVAEDNENNQQLIQKTLEDLGFTVIMVSNGKEAIEYRQMNECDIIFMDIAMPIMDGVEANHQILAYESIHNLSHIPMIAMTTNALHGDKERFMKEGFDAMITKPLQDKDICSLLNLFFSQEIPMQDAMSDASILLLKKSPLESKLYKHVLMQWCQYIDEATSYETFKEMIVSSQYTLLLFDKEMLLDGEEVFHDWLKNLVDGQKIKSIHTAICIDSKEKNSQKQYFDAVLLSPINKKELETVIKPLMG